MLRVLKRTLSLHPVPSPKTKVITTKLVFVDPLVLMGAIIFDMYVSARRGQQTQCLLNCLDQVALLANMSLCCLGVSPNRSGDFSQGVVGAVVQYVGSCVSAPPLQIPNACSFRV